MRRKLLVIALVVCFLINIVYAQEIRFVGEQNTLIDLTETCSLNELPCPSSFDCNITIEDPSQNIIIINQEMTRNDTIYNYTLSEDNTNPLGIYEVKSVFCTDGNFNGTSSFFFRVTPSGAEPINSGGGLTILGTFLVLMLGIIFFLIFGILTKNIPFKIFFVSLSVILMVATLGYSVITAQEVLGSFSKIVSTYGTFYVLLTILLTAGVIGLIIYLIVAALKSLDSTRRFFKGGGED